MSRIFVPISRRSSPTSVSEDGEILISVIKGSVDKSSENAKYQVDGLSGATITSNGVTNLLSFWLGDMGYGPLITQLKNKELKDV